MKSSWKKVFMLAGTLALGSTLFAPGSSFAAVSNPNYQVFLSNLAGTPITNPVTVTISFYDSAIGGTPYWSETQTVTPDSGLCIVNLGGGTPFNLDFSRTYYVGVSVAGAGENATRLMVNGPGAYSRAGDKTNAREFNVKYEWLNLE